MMIGNVSANPGSSCVLLTKEGTHSKLQDPPGAAVRSSKRGLSLMVLKTTAGYPESWSLKKLSCNLMSNNEKLRSTWIKSIGHREHDKRLRLKNLHERKLTSADIG